jgi:hypothetical protein
MASQRFNCRLYPDIPVNDGMPFRARVVFQDGDREWVVEDVLCQSPEEPSEFGDYEPQDRCQPADAEEAPF